MQVLTIDKHKHWCYSDFMSMLGTRHEAPAKPLPETLSPDTLLSDLSALSQAAQKAAEKSHQARHNRDAIVARLNEIDSKPLEPEDALNMAAQLLALPGLPREAEASRQDAQSLYELCRAKYVGQRVDARIAEQPDNQSPRQTNGAIEEWGLGGVPNAWSPHMGGGGWGVWDFPKEASGVIRDLFTDGSLKLADVASPDKAYLVRPFRSDGTPAGLVFDFVDGPKPG